MIEIHRDIEQGTEEWLRVRAGIPTASQFGELIDRGQGKTRRTYMLKLAGEILTGEPMPGFSNQHTRRGHEQEDEARETYGFIREVDVEQVGFIRNGDKGGSPDGLVGIDGGCEVKTKLPHLHLEVLLAEEVPAEHMPQIDGLIWVAEREWWDFISYCRGLPPFIKRVYRDEKRIRKISRAIDQFNQELADIVEKVRRGSEPMHAPDTIPAQEPDLDTIF
ncbi:MULTISPECIES: lambda exonuclease family protein [unclassified Thioalkalivibrio]|uniref:lambda exonuclease family protein n=1 Tax=unclassified Thioalkalivibrio TaxID=2621013 RepID=UPI000362C268|nr:MULTISPECIES: lambda exonuclease family protein [unclassified Thioalkalivibrio]